MNPLVKYQDTFVDRRPLTTVAAVAGTILAVWFAGSQIQAAVSDTTNLSRTAEGLYGSEPIKVRDFFFAPRADGGYDVVDHTTGRMLQELLYDRDGFAVTTLRGLHTERRKLGLPADLPFTLSIWPKGRVTLHDSATGRLLELTAFGPTNATAFAVLASERSSTN